MASGSISLTSSKAWRGKISWSSTSNIAGNYSDVYVYAGMWKTDGYLTSSNSYTSGTITINGTSYSLIGYQEFEDEVCIFEDTIRIYHNSDGSKSIAISLTCSGQASTSLSGYTLSGSGTAVLDTIPRTSTLSASSGTLGTAQTLTITKASDSLTHTITYTCGSLSGTIVSKTSASSVSWTPPLSLAAANTTGASVTAKLTLTTYSGSTAIGTHTISVLYTIGSALAPTFTVEFTDATGYADTYGDGKYIQLLSKLNIKVTPTTYYGATIKSYKITANGETFTDAEATTSALNAYGNIQVYVYIQDSRGKYAQEYFYVSAREYTAPNVSSLTIKRCDSDGTENDQGEYVQVTYSANAHPLYDSSDTAKNTVSYKLEYKKSSASSFTTVNLTDYTDNFYISGKTYIFAADTGSSYNVQLTVTDAFQSVMKATLASTAATIMHFKADGSGIGLGKVSEVADTIDCGWKINMNNHSIENVADPEEDTDAANKGYVDVEISEAISPILLTVYPVGAIYISTSSTSPASLFGGTWSQITNRFLLAAGSSYTAGKTGGAATHTLTVSEMPKHRHWGNARFDYDMVSGTHPSAEQDGGSSNILYSNYEGGSSAHNNMPPYLVVYVWKRTA